MPRLSIKKQTTYQLQNTIASYTKSINAIESNWGFTGLHHEVLLKKVPKDVQAKYRHLQSMIKGAKQELEDRNRIRNEYTKPKDVIAERKRLQLIYADLLQMSYNQTAMQKLFTETRIFIQTYNL